MASIRWRNLKIGAKFGIALFITIILFIIATAFATFSLLNIQQAVKDIELTSQRSNTLTHMGSLFRAKEIVIMDYSNLARESLIKEYEEITKQYKSLHQQIEPTMNTEDLKFLYDRIQKNNTEMDIIFQNDVIPKMQSEMPELAKKDLVTIAGLRGPTIQIFDRLKAFVDLETDNAIKFAHSNIQNAIKVLAISIISVIILGSFIVFMVSRAISKNLNKVVKVTDSIAKGHLNVDEIKYNGNDEIGQLTMAVNKMLHNLRNMIKGITESSYEVDKESNSLREIADQVQQGSEQIAATMQEMSAGAEEQAGSATEISSSISNLTDLVNKANTNKEELDASSKGILGVVSEGNTEMKTSVITMNEINSILKDSVEKVKKLDENSQKVSVLVQIINDISEQTNLLALNAAIEAARAGEAGRGFAVVAEEIRKLAEQVGTSVNEITDIVLGIQNESKSMTKSLEDGYSKVEEGTHVIRSTGDVFEKINNEVNVMAEKIQEVSNSLDEISVNCNNINTAGEQIAAISEENSAGIEETVASVQQQNSSMEHIAENAHTLTTSAEVLKKLVRQFNI